MPHHIHTQHGRVYGFYKVPGANGTSKPVPLSCKTCAKYGKETAQCALPVGPLPANPSPQQIQQALFQTGLTCIGPDPVKQTLQRLCNPPYDHGFAPGITNSYITFIQGCVCI